MNYNLLIVFISSIVYCVVAWHDEWLSLNSSTITSAIALRVLLKSLPLIFLMRTGFGLAWSLQDPKPAKFGRGILLGLFASAFGDILLELSWVRAHFFIVALFSFLLAHLSYAYSFFLQSLARHTPSSPSPSSSSNPSAPSPAQPSALAAALPRLFFSAMPWLFLLLSLLYRFLPSVPPAFHLPVVAHVLADFLLVWAASLRLGRPDSSRSSQIFALLGACLALVGDAIEAFQKFHHKSDISSVSIMFVYYLSQTFITLSIKDGLFVLEKKQK